MQLSEEEKKRIIYFHEHLNKWSYYELLQLKRKDDAKTIKRAYFSRSKEWHPDRFRREKLGSFKPMLDAIFRKIQTAYGTLSKPEQKKTYDQEHVPLFDEDEMADLLAEQRRAERDDRRKQDAARRRRDRNPVRRRMMQAKEFVEEAKRLQESGDPLAALRAVQTAIAFHEKPEYQKFEEELKRATGELRVGPLLRRGQNAEKLTNWHDAIEIFQEAVRLAPQHGVARLRLAYNMLMAGRDPQEINDHAQRALALLPNEPEAHLVRGMCYERGGMEKAAARAYSRALELKPNYAEAKKRHKKLKWGF